VCVWAMSVLQSALLNKLLAKWQSSENE